MKGFDFDGVITKGIRPSPGDVIITGRTPEDATRTHADMIHYKVDPKTPIYYMPPQFKQRGTRQGLIDTAIWKSMMIGLLQLTDFYEDDPVQHQTIVDMLKNEPKIDCTVHKV